MATIPNVTVPRYFDMDPTTDDLISRGDKLKNGMVVLLEADILRGNPNARPGSTMYDYETKKSKESNRWCMVTELEVRSSRDNGYTNKLVEFVGVYSDGTKRKRTYGNDYAWFVKLDSFPDYQANKTFIDVQKVKAGDWVKAEFYSSAVNPNPAFTYTIEAVVALGGRAMPIERSLTIRNGPRFQILRQADGSAGGNLVKILEHRTAKEEAARKQQAEIQALRERLVGKPDYYGYGYSLNDKLR
jgi:hypothetical protein